MDLMFNTILYLEYDIGQHYNKRVGQVEQQPDLHWLDVRGGGEDVTRTSGLRYSVYLM